MVNLPRFCDKAEYADCRNAALSMRAACEIHGTAVLRLPAKYGVRIIQVGDVCLLAIGRVEQLWDEVALVEYPTRAALRATSTSPEWQRLAVYRTVGLAGQLNVAVTQAQRIPAPGIGANLGVSRC